jgi:hypothetical protein
VIKRIRFATKRAGLSSADFAASWRDAMTRAANAPAGARPARLALCFTLADVDGGDARHEGVALEWFVDADHLARYESWLGSDNGRAHAAAVDAVVDLGASPLLVADEQVMRGADWLEQRWRDGDDKLKHMAVALRAHGLTQAEFSERWRSRAGRVGATPIPDEARGLAYVQNHPVPGGWAYDALNEVYFDDLDSLRRRVEWFRDLGDTEDDLVRENWFLIAREELLLP